MNVYVDMDGVLVNLVATMWKIKPESHGTYDFKDHWFDSFFTGDWELMTPYPWVADLLELVGNTGPVSLLTVLPKYGTFNAAAGKIQWVETNLGKMPVAMCYNGSKDRFGHGLLIDDFEENCRAWEINHCGPTILFPQPYNMNREWVGREMEYVKQELEYRGLYD